MTGKMILMLAVLSGSLVLGLLFTSLGYDNTWGLWNIDPMPLPFADLRAITGASVALASGMDPLLSNPGDPWGRTVNYPRPWLLLSALAGPEDTIALGIALVGLFLVGVFLSAPRTLDVTSAILLVLTIFSPAVLFCIERGNTDLLVFFLLAVSVCLSRRKSAAASAAATAVILLAGALKLYPVCALAFLLGERRRTFYALAAGAGILVCLYLALSYRDLLLIYSHTPRAEDWAYGIDIWPRWLFPLSGSSVRVPSYAMVAAGLFVGLLHARKDNPAPRVAEEGASADSELLTFRMGGAIYAGTFLLGSNYDYKLIFLLLTFPQLVAWARASIHSFASTARWTLAAIIVSAWVAQIRGLLGFTPLGSRAGFALDELANWGVFIGLSALLAKSAPKWLHADLSLLLTRKRTTPGASLLILSAASALIALAALAYLALLPSDPARAVIGRYSTARVILMVGPFIAATASAVLFAACARDRERACRIADVVYASSEPIRLLGAGACALGFSFMVVLSLVRPNWVERVNPDYACRLLPYFLLPSILLGLYWFTRKLALAPKRERTDKPAGLPPPLSPGG